ncbi:VOC family protein [Armatimonas rosea]|uniref:VOC domain-containing protein n=1 Tax=Armatimonas rosea TaxID=685828 RepID=A0A7W9ST67_ARMRO|nr:VOC family protein [Armatimonas rosea]MBB6052400.1 hypothetical protein [Armatimonas rosea]
MSRVIHFELPAENPERAMAFYSQVFGWQFQKWEGPMDYWLVTTGPAEAFGINGGLAAQQPEMPKAPINVIDVVAIDDAIAAVKAAGGTITMEKHEIPGVGWLAYFTDTEGIVSGLMQPLQGQEATGA